MSATLPADGAPPRALGAREPQRDGPGRRRGAQQTPAVEVAARAEPAALAVHRVGALVVVVGAIFGGGLVYENVVLANEVVAQIGPDTVTAAQLLDEMRRPARRIDAQAKPAAVAPRPLRYVDQQKRSLPDQTLERPDRYATSSSRRPIDAASACRPPRWTTRCAKPSPRSTSRRILRPRRCRPRRPKAACPTSVPTPFPTPDRSITPTAIPTLDATAYGPALQQLLDRNFFTEPELRQVLHDQELQDASRRQSARNRSRHPGTGPRPAHPGGDRGCGERRAHPVAGRRRLRPARPARCRPTRIKGQGR